MRQATSSETAIAISPFDALTLNKANFSVTTSTSANLLSMPAAALLKAFGSGLPVPGSGSAAAFSGLIACNLLLTVAAITKLKEEYTSVHDEMDVIVSRLRSAIEPSLVRNFQKDSDAFTKVISSRKCRDCEFDPVKKRQLAEQALADLRVATEIPLEICMDCLSIGRMGLTMFDIGFKSVRGDSGGAVCNAIAGARTSVFVVFLNLKSFRSGKWAQGAHARCESMLQEIEEIDRRLFARVTRLKAEAGANLQLTFPFDRISG
jgi:formiminotetrahydrofolate cyclodeaminase